MPRQFRFALIVLLALGTFVSVPSLAWKESQRESYDAATELTLRYAREVLHRTDEAASQAQEAIEQLRRANQPPCSGAELALMRQLDLTSTYLQAVGRTRDGTMLCSSMNGQSFGLGKDVFRTATGVNIYLKVPLEISATTPLIAIERDGFAVLIHRNLPLDSLAASPEVALGVFQLDRKNYRGAELERGDIRRIWLTQAGSKREASFIDGDRVVAVSRSTRFRIAAVAALPIAAFDDRTQAIAWRLVPAGALAGLAVAVAIGLLAQRQASLAGSMRAALRRNEFFVLYQPIIELGTGRCVGAEALMRWRRWPDELIGADLFIPVAEQSGMIGMLTKRMVQIVQRDGGAYLAAHPDFHVALNISATDLESNAIIGLLDDFMAHSGAQPSNLIIEITERCFVKGETAKSVIAGLHERHIEVAIDDFGTGYSSLSQLELLDLDFLKIDRAFVDTIGTSAPTSQVVGHIISMARTMGLRMIAEGVEHEIQAQFLKSQEVQYAQGWLFGKPIPFAELLRMVEETDQTLST
jgi:sensor c-di-GMP phosphodiesterase-like protein